MAKIVAKVGSIVDREGNSVDPTKRSAGSGNSFRVIEPGFYVARVKSLKFGDYRAAFKGFPSKEKDKKWTYWKLTPEIELVNPEKTLINRQDVQIGVVKDGTLVRPDGDKEKSAIWTSAQYLLGALGLLSKGEDEQFTLSFDPDLVANRMIKVRTAIGGYIKGETGYDEKQMNALLLDVNDGQEYDFSEIPELIERWNEDNGYDNEDEVRLKAKNVVTSFFALDTKTIEEAGFYLDDDTGAVYETEADYTTYLALVDASDNYEEPNY